MRSEIIEKMAALITAAFGLVAALAWNGAVRAIFEELFGTANNILAMVVYAITVTIIAVLVTIWIARASSRAREQK